jgi:AraC-like DNA-binding protein
MYRDTLCKNWYILEGDAQVTSVGHIAATMVHPRRILQEWVLGIVVSGSRTIMTANEEGYLTSGDYFLLPPNQLHCGIEEDCHDVYYIHFKMKGTKTNPPHELSSNRIVLPIYGHLPKNIDLTQVFRYLNEYYYSSPLVSEHYLNVQVQSILYQISFYMQKKKVWTSSSRLDGDDIIEFIYDNFKEELNYRVFEEKFNLSYRQLNKIFKAQFDTTIKQKIIDIRIQHAFNLLTQGASISTAASESGFKDYFYFIKCFKRVKNITPNELRKKYINT